MVNNENTLFNNFCETIEKHELLSATKRLIFLFFRRKRRNYWLIFFAKIPRGEQDRNKTPCDHGTISKTCLF